MLGPLVTVPENAGAGVSVSSIVSVPSDVDGFVFGTHWSLAAPEAEEPAPVSAAHDSGTALVSFALYFTSVKGSFTHPLSVPLSLTVWIAAVFERPGESFTLALFSVQRCAGAPTVYAIEAVACWPSLLFAVTM